MPSLEPSHRPGDRPDTHPTSVISNGLLRATVWSPDAERGFYRSTRFDWSGVIAALDYKGQQFYGPWFTGRAPEVRDFAFRGPAIVAGPRSAMVGPAEEFPRPQGYDAAGLGGLFLKIGVGLLRRTTDAPYHAIDHYDLVDGGDWTVAAEADAVTFTHEAGTAGAGYAYIYRKTVRLVPGAPVMTIAHTLQNTGHLPLESTQYNHNFLVLPGATSGPDFTIAAAFPIRTARTPDPALAVIRDGRLVFVRPLTGDERVSVPLDGFGPLVTDYRFRIDHHPTGSSIHMTGDRSLVRAHLWSLRSVLSIEPFVDVSTDPGATSCWTYTYRYAVTPG